MKKAQYMIFTKYCALYTFQKLPTYLGLKLPKVALLANY